MSPQDILNSLMLQLQLQMRFGKNGVDFSASPGIASNDIYWGSNIDPRGTGYNDADPFGQSYFDPGVDPVNYDDVIRKALMKNRMNQKISP